MSDSDPWTQHQTNQRAWDRLVTKNAPLARPARDEDFVNPLRTVDGAGWLGPSIQGWRVLCLAAGGGRQGPLYAAAGAQVTVVDLSPAMLELDRQVATERRLELRTIQSSMEHLPMLADASFDCVIHPVSTCYVPQVAPVFAEVARLLRGGGVYISQHKSPVNLQASYRVGSEKGYYLRHPYYSREPVPPPQEASWSAERLREAGATEYLHRWEEIIGGICRAGFVIEDLTEPVHGEADAEVDSFAHRGRFIAPYVRIKAKRNAMASRGLLIGASNTLSL